MRGGCGLLFLKFTSSAACQHYKKYTINKLARPILKPWKRMLSVLDPQKRGHD